MESDKYWQNFELGKEIEIACGFIYDGLHRLHEMETLHYETEIFSVLYNLSVGLERFLKVAVVLAEFDENTEPLEYEKTLITHNHLELLNRVKNKYTVNLGPNHNEFLALLGKFYKSFRYDRYSIQTVYETSKEKQALLKFLNKYLDIDIEENQPFKYVRNNWRIKKYIGKTIGKIVEQLYEIISNSATGKNIFTYEIRCHTKAYKLILGKEYDFFNEDILWKELLIFLLNTKDESSYLDFIRGIDPLEFDIGLVSDYLRSIGSDIIKIYCTEELECLYEGIENKRDRLEKVTLIADPNVYFD